MMLSVDCLPVTSHCLTCCLHFVDTPDWLEMSGWLAALPDLVNGFLVLSLSIAGKHAVMFILMTGTD